jgi:hypothetical protein
VNSDLKQKLDALRAASVATPKEALSDFVIARVEDDLDKASKAGTIIRLWAESIVGELTHTEWCHVCFTTYLSVVTTPVQWGSKDILAGLFFWAVR